MRIRTQTTVNKFPDMQRQLQIIDGKKINVGVKGEQAWLAAIHEYGCRIRITPKMRAWLHKNGLHVKNSTTEIVIPERSFLRKGFDEKHMKAIEKAERVLPLVISGDMSSDQFYEIVGTLLRDGIKDYAVSLNSPPNHPFTVDRKSSSNPLVDSGDLINAIEFDIE